MEKIHLSVTPNLILRLLSDGTLRRADSHQESSPEKKWIKWISSLPHVLEAHVRKS
jgi:hypothetical protein